jgi:hypothetical protein
MLKKKDSLLNFLDIIKSSDTEYYTLDLCTKNEFLSFRYQ